MQRLASPHQKYFKYKLQLRFTYHMILDQNEFTKKNFPKNWLAQPAYLTVVLREIWNISEIEKMKNCSKVQFYMGKMNFWSKCAYVSWLLRYSVFSILTKISWRIFLPKLQKNWAWLNISESTCGFAFIRRFQKWYNFWKSIIQQLTYKQFAV